MSSTGKLKYSKPEIATFNLEEGVIDTLREQFTNLYAGSLGKKIKLQYNNTNQTYFLKPIYNFPSNLSEFDIFIVNMCSNEYEDYNSEDHMELDCEPTTSSFFVVKYPETIFDPRPIAIADLRDKLDSTSDRKQIFIVFADKPEITQYETKELTQFTNPAGSIESSEEYFDNYTLCKSNSLTIEEKFGHYFEIICPNSKLRTILEKHLKGSEYRAIFNSQKQKKAFTPYILNKDKEIVSCLDIEQDKSIFYFPNIQDKASFLSEVLNEFLPEYVADLFPEHTLNSWLKHKEYYLPKHMELTFQKEQIENDYRNEVNRIDQEIEEINKKYSFLHDMLTETGDELVKAVKHFLEWLGFENVINCDEENRGKKEEDIRIELDDGLIIIEVKGIKGTSKDDDCAQISKISGRRCAERDTATSIYSLYIVNHQRSKAPRKRHHPFFNDKTNDAKISKRGLLTTWQLFRLCFLIEDGIILKEQAQKCLKNNGIIEFFPENSIQIGKFDQKYKQGSVIILHLQGIKISVGDELLLVFDRNDMEMEKFEVQNIQVYDEDVQEAEDGDVGIELNGSIKKKWKKGEVFLLRKEENREKGVEQ